MAVRETGKRTKEERRFAVPPDGVDVLEALWYHRLLSIRQINRLFTPQFQERWTRKIMAELAGWGLVASIPVRSAGAPNYWYLTAEGGRTVAQISDNVHGQAPSAEAVASVFQAHTVALNDTGIAFVESARDNDDDCLPLAWEHEVEHRMGNAAGEIFRCDGLLRYGIMDGNKARQRHYFLEVDRLTETMDQLVEKLRRYANYRRWVDPDSRPGTALGGLEAWRHKYPAFPHLLFVFTPSRPSHSRNTMTQRAKRVLAMAAQDPIVRLTLSGSDDFVVGACLLEDLQRRGPYEAIFYEIESKPAEKGRGSTFTVRKEPVNILGQNDVDLNPDGKLV